MPATWLIESDTADVLQISNRHTLADEENDATVRRLSTTSWTPEPSAGLAVDVHLQNPAAENILLLLGCMNCWPAEICMISKLRQIRASTLWSPLITHERVRFQCCCNRLRPALSNVLMEITTDLLFAGMSSTLRSYSLENLSKIIQ